MTTIAATIDATGIHAPTYADVLEYLKTQFRSIYGQDVYLEADSQDGQLLAVFAACINDANSATVGCYNTFSPRTAQGGALSSNVKINGIKRDASSFSTVDLLIVGQAGTLIANGAAQDVSGIKWSLPTQIAIPPAGQIIVTAICQTPGAIAAAEGTITQIATPVRGWQTVNNPSTASIGAPVESDAALR